LAHVGSLKRLREFRAEFYECQITDTGLQSLSRLDGLEVLVLSGKSISDDGLSSLARLSRLRVLRLRLRDSHVTNRGLAQLATLSQLESLSLDGVQATEEGLIPLARLRGLTDIYVQGPNLQGGAELSKALPGCKVNISDRPSSAAY
jgi:hypothetical protein